MIYKICLFIFFSFGIFMFYSVGNLIYTLFKVSKKEYDELQRKTILDSLACSMLLILLLHLIQFIVGSVIGTYYPVITPVIKNFKINYLSWNEGFLSINSFFFDCTIISISYIVSKYKNGLISKKQFLTPIFIIFTVIFIIILTMLTSSIYNA
ncbi:hypothetical protein [Miniphocaeibacter massiliensis]|uniref:hypothetical protein n=1 Tax=Miniphocaeibacter massiliensis TaxID=2041841 RepID=UPI000C1B8013|nr:hypothetical protein [Miniphocaeibacter massiliensis]